MANEEKQVILVKAKTYTDGRYKFKQGIPVTMPEKQAKKYEGHHYFQVRTLQQAAAYAALEGRPNVNPASLTNKAVSEESARVKKRVPLKKVAAQDSEDESGEE